MQSPCSTLSLTPNSRKANVKEAHIATQRCSWTLDDEKELLSFLLKHRAEDGDGMSVKTSMWAAAEKHMAEFAAKQAGSKGITGGPKTAQACKNKYFKFRQTYSVVLAITEFPGIEWDDELGTNVDDSDPASISVWNTYVEKHKDAKPFRNTGWPLFKTMKSLLPAMRPRGPGKAFNARFSDGKEPDTKDSTEELRDYNGDEVDGPGGHHEDASNSDEETRSVAAGGESLLSELRDSIASCLTLSRPQHYQVTPLGSHANIIGSSRASSPAAYSHTKRRRCQCALSTCSDFSGQSSNEPDRKRQRTEEEVMDNFIREFSLFRQAFAAACAKPQYYPVLTEAVRRAQELETYLDDASLVVLLKDFRDHPTSARVYLAISRDSLRQAWVQEAIRNYQPAVSGLP